MTRYVREVVEIADHSSLDAVIATLTSLRDTLPAGTEAELRMKGDDVFGRRLSVCFLRPLTEEEAALEARYGGGDPELGLAA